MSAGHSLRRENYTFTHFMDATGRSSAHTEGHVPGSFAVIFTVALTATLSFIAMDPVAAAWLFRALDLVWMLLTA